MAEWKKSDETEKRVRAGLRETIAFAGLLLSLFLPFYLPVRFEHETQFLKKQIEAAPWSFAAKFEPFLKTNRWACSERLFHAQERSLSLEDPAHIISFHTRPHSPPPPPPHPLLILLPSHSTHSILCLRYIYITNCMHFILLYFLIGQTTNLAHLTSTRGRVSLDKLYRSTHHSRFHAHRYAN